MGLLTTNPADAVTLPKNDRPAIDPPTAEEVLRLLRALKGSRYHALFVLSADSGARPGELLALRWQDVDLDAGKITIQRSIQRKRKGQPWAFEKPKNDKSRTLDLAPDTVRELKAHRASQAKERLAAGMLYDPEGFDLVFASPLGQPLHHRNVVLRSFKPALAKAGLPKKTRWYDLRHFVATALLGAGVPINVVSERLGHSGSQITLDTYVHHIPNMQAQAAANLQAILGGGRPETPPMPEAKPES